MRDSHAHYVLKRCMRPEPENGRVTGVQTCLRSIDEARLLLNEADGYARRAHQMQTQLIGQDAGEARQPMTLIMVHAQDHLMNSLLAREFSEELIHLYQR